jgi:hypothetical protein
MKKTSRAVLGAALLAVSGFAAAASATVYVDAKANSVSNGTGVDAFLLSAGESFSVTASGIWQNDPSGGSYISGPDGHSDQSFTLGSYTFDVGTLVGELDGTFFKVGSNYSGVASTGGELALFYWDSDASNNLGFVQATVTGTPAVSPVPEPANLALMALALGAFALTSRRKV